MADAIHILTTTGCRLLLSSTSLLQLSQRRTDMHSRPTTDTANSEPCMNQERSRSSRDTQQQPSLACCMITGCSVGCCAALLGGMSCTTHHWQLMQPCCCWGHCQLAQAGLLHLTESLGQAANHSGGDEVGALTAGLQQQG